MHLFHLKNARHLSTLWHIPMYISFSLSSLRCLKFFFFSSKNYKLPFTSLWSYIVHSCAHNMLPWNTWQWNHKYEKKDIKSVEDCPCLVILQLLLLRQPNPQLPIALFCLVTCYQNGVNCVWPSCLPQHIKVRIC